MEKMYFEKIFFENVENIFEISKIPLESTHRVGYGYLLKMRKNVQMSLKSEDECKIL